jgi:hypothetical protein
MSGRQLRDQTTYRVSLATSVRQRPVDVDCSDLSAVRLGRVCYASSAPMAHDIRSAGHQIRIHGKRQRSVLFDWLHVSSHTRSRSCSMFVETHSGTALLNPSTRQIRGLERMPERPWPRMSCQKSIRRDQKAIPSTNTTEPRISFSPGAQRNRGHSPINKIVTLVRRGREQPVAVKSRMAPPLRRVLQFE